MNNWDRFLWWYFEGNFKWYLITFAVGLVIGKLI